MWNKLRGNIFQHILQVAKKIGTLLVALAAVLAMSVVALADTVVLNNGVAVDSTTAGTKLDNSVLILKDLKVYNTTGGNIYLPTVGYTYTITGEDVAEGTTVTDSDNHTGHVYAGVAAALDGTAKRVGHISVRLASAHANTRRGPSLPRP